MPATDAANMPATDTTSMPAADAAAPPTFSFFFARFFARRYPAFAPLLRDAQTGFAAAVYLFRYDTRLSVDFIARSVDAVSRAIADVSGKSVPEARRLFTAGVRDAAREYFRDGWADVAVFVKANAQELTNVQLQSTQLAKITDEMDREPAPEVDPVLLQRLLEQRLPVMLMVYADYCSVCKQVRPLFEQASADVSDRMFFVRLNGPRSPEVKEAYSVASYPTILRCESNHVAHFPKANNHMTVQNILAFARNDALQPSDDEGDEDDMSALSSRRSRAFEWESLLKRQGIDELDALASERRVALAATIPPDADCTAASCSVRPDRSLDAAPGIPPPLCIMLGGGMGAGKTTAVGLVSATPFWQEYGSGVVVVEADAFKMNDPLFHVLQSVTPLASRIVHKDSIAAAEELFLKAANGRRDIVFDGTLSWFEYARQTVEMLRDTEHLWKRGPGYVETDAGVVEQYWERAERREQPAPAYRVELVGVTAHPEISVMRGIVRKITTGRAVPVQDQLKSHALFSQNFEKYIELVDSAYLFDTTRNEGAVEEKDGYASQLVALKQGVLFSNPDEEDEDADGAEDVFVVRYSEAYKRFLKKRFLNTEAQGTAELYKAEVVEVVSE